jgi:hypothetical protein
LYRKSNAYDKLKALDEGNEATRNIHAARALLDAIIKDAEPLFGEWHHYSFDWPVWKLQLSTFKDSLQACSRMIRQDDFLSLPSGHLSLLTKSLRHLQSDVLFWVPELTRTSSSTPLPAPPGAFLRILYPMDTLRRARSHYHPTKNSMDLLLGRVKAHLDHAMMIMEHYLKYSSGGPESHVRICMSSLQ